MPAFRRQARLLRRCAQRQVRRGGTPVSSYALVQAGKPWERIVKTGGGRGVNAARQPGRHSN